MIAFLLGLATTVVFISVIAFIYHTLKRNITLEIQNKYAEQSNQRIKEYVQKSKKIEADTAHLPRDQLIDSMRNDGEIRDE